MSDEGSTSVIAVCGKGGVGKTVISAMLTRLLAEDSSRKILAIDADPAIGLSSALGIEIHRTVDDIRNDLIRRYREGEKSDRDALIKQLDYDLFELIRERNNLAFLAIGRPETDGCYCQVNSLLKDIIRDIAFNFDFVVIDAEAGIEQVNRRVMALVTHLFLVSDISAKARNVAATIEKVARQAIAFKDAMVLFNRIRAGDESGLIKDNSLPRVIGFIPEDDIIREFDREGKCLFDLPESPGLAALRKAVDPLWPLTGGKD